MKENARRHALLREIGVAGSGHTVGQHAVEGKRGRIVREPVRNRAERLCHRPGIDYRQHGDPEESRQVGTARRAVVKTHDAFDQDEVGGAGRLVEEPAAMRLASHPQIELIDRPAARALENHGVEKVRTRLEHLNRASLRGVIPRQSGSNGSLSLTRGRCADEESRATPARHDQRALGRGPRRVLRDLSYGFPSVRYSMTTGVAKRS